MVPLSHSEELVSARSIPGIYKREKSFFFPLKERRKSLPDRIPAKASGYQMLGELPENVHYSNAKSRKSYAER